MSESHQGDLLFSLLTHKDQLLNLCRHFWTFEKRVVGSTIKCLPLETGPVTKCLPWEAITKFRQIPSILLQWKGRYFRRSEPSRFNDDDSWGSYDALPAPGKWKKSKNGKKKSQPRKHICHSGDHACWGFIDLSWFFLFSSAYSYWLTSFVPFVPNGNTKWLISFPSPPFPPHKWEAG